MTSWSLWKKVAPWISPMRVIHGALKETGSTFRSWMLRTSGAREGDRPLPRPEGVKHSLNLSRQARRVLGACHC